MTRILTITVALLVSIATAQSFPPATFDSATGVNLPAGTTRIPADSCEELLTLVDFNDGRCYMTATTRYTDGLTDMTLNMRLAGYTLIAEEPVPSMMNNYNVTLQGWTGREDTFILYISDPDYYLLLMTPMDAF